MIGPNTPLSLNPLYRLQWEPAQDCHVLLFPEGMIQLNPPAAEILKRCQANATLTSVVEDLQNTFPEASGLEADVQEFLVVAQDKGWVNLG